MSGTIKTFIDGLLAIAFLGALVGLAIGSIAVVAIWIVRVLT